MRKKKLTIKYLLLISGIILVLTGIILSIYMNYLKNHSKENKINLDFKLIDEEKKTKEEKREQVSCKEKLDAYRNEYNNKDIIAEIEIKDTNIKSIVTKTTDNEFYLNHSLTKDYDAVGTIFMDYRVNINSRKILLYGHNSQNIDTIFHNLENYLNEDFYKNHKDITLYTDLDTLTYRIFSVMIVTNDFQYYLTDFEDDMWLPHLYSLKSKSIYDTKETLESKDEVLILQTCYYYPKGSYIVIAAKKI